MSYSPNSIPVFQAAFSGAIAGMGVVGKNISDATAAHYATLCNIAGAWAIEFDTRYSGHPADQLSVTMIEDLCEGYWSERQPTSEPQFQVPATYQVGCDAIIAVVLEGETYFSGQGITPTPIGGGGSGDTWQTDLFTATDGQTVFNLDNDAFPDGDLIFFVNGIAYRNGVDYTVVLNEVTWDKHTFDLVDGDFCMALYPYVPV